MTRATKSAFLVLLCSLAGCGGQQPTTETASGSEDGFEGSSDSGDVATSASGPNCDDGTCFPCGEGICPKGSFCDLGAAGGPACAWLTECAGDPSCSCVQGVLGASCSCQGDQGGPVVQCD